MLRAGDTTMLKDLEKDPKKKRKRTYNDDEGGDEDGATAGNARAYGRAMAYKRLQAKKAKLQAETAEPRDEQGLPKYRNRAAERQKGQAEFEKINEEWEAQKNIEPEQSKFLGGDLEHTHLVKGLDFALLSKVKTEMARQEKKEQLQQQHLQKKQDKKKKTAAGTELGKKVYQAVVETLHPHHGTYKQRLKKMGKAIAMGQRIRGAPNTFLPGRMQYEFDTKVEMGREDIPMIVYQSKENCPAVDWSKKVASMLPETVALVKKRLEAAKEAKKQRKRDREAGNDPGGMKVVAKKVALPKDNDDDIFGGVGRFDTAETTKALVEKQEKEKEKAAPSKEKSRDKREKEIPKKKSYFDDAGKIDEVPEGQLEVKDLAYLDDKEEEEKGSGLDMDKDFRAAERYEGVRPGWSFKTGEFGLGYYRDSKATQINAPDVGGGLEGDGHEIRKGKRGHREEKKKRGAAPPEDDNDAYGECFPAFGQAHHEHASDDEDPEAMRKREKKEAKMGLTPGSLLDEKKDKKKDDEGKQWTKIDKMIKEKKTGSIDDIMSKAMKTPGGGGGRTPGGRTPGSRGSGGRTPGTGGRTPF